MSAGLSGVQVKNTFLDFGRQNSESTRGRRLTAPPGAALYEMLSAPTAPTVTAPTTVGPATTVGTRRVSMVMTSQPSVGVSKDRTNTDMMDMCNVMTAQPSVGVAQTTTGKRQSYGDVLMTPQPSLGVPVLTVTAHPSIGIAPQQSLGTTKTLTLGSPAAVISKPASAPMLPLPTRIRVGSALSAVSASSPNSTKPHGLSFDVPRTPESSYVGGSCGSMYNFGMPATTGSPVKVAPTICETAPTYSTSTTSVPGKSATERRVSITAPAQLLPPSNGYYTGMAPGAVSTSAAPRAMAAPQMAPQAMQGNPYMMAGYGGMYQHAQPYMQQGAYMQMPVAMPGYAGAMNNAPAMQAEGMCLNLGSLISPHETVVAAPASWASDGLVTTVMLRNIPLKYIRETLLAEIDARGFVNGYDFFYLPIDFHTGNCVGYAFINFVDEALVGRFRAAYDGLQLSPDSAKICAVSNAKAQGKLKNIEQYRNSSVMSMEDRYRPVVFENGVRQPFPPPTRLLKPVKPRARNAPSS